MDFTDVVVTPERSRTDCDCLLERAVHNRRLSKGHIWFLFMVLKKLIANFRMIGYLFF